MADDDDDGVPSSNLITQKHQQKGHQKESSRAEIDTSLPFQSVKDAVSLFNGKSDLIQFKVNESPGTRKIMYQKDEPGRPKPSSARSARTRSASELSKLKKHAEEQLFIEPCSPKGSVSSPIPCKKQESESSICEEKMDKVWETQLKHAEEQHAAAVTTMKRIEEIQKEVGTSHRQAMEALTSSDVNSRTVVEDLNTTHIGPDNSLVLVKLARRDSGKENMGMPYMDNTQINSILVPEQDLVACMTILELETKLAVATEELTRLQEELAVANEAEERVAKAASVAFKHLDYAKAEFEKARIAANNASNAFSTELEMTRRNLDMALENGASLQAATQALQSELESMRKELADLRGREANARSAFMNLTEELSKTKEDLNHAITAEAKANERISGLSKSLEMATAEAEEAKCNAKTLEQELSKAKEDEEKAKAAMRRAESRLHKALRTTEEAKCSEVSSLQRFQEVFDGESISRSALNGDSYNCLATRSRVQGMYDTKDPMLGKTVLVHQDNHGDSRIEKCHFIHHQVGSDFDSHPIYVLNSPDPNFPQILKFTSLEKDSKILSQIEQKKKKKHLLSTIGTFIGRKSLG